MPEQALQSDALLANLTAPAILFFALGALAAWLRSDLTIPEQISKTIALYLMLCIGFKGGVAARMTGVDVNFLQLAALGVTFSCLIPIGVYFILRHAVKLDRATAAATAAHYGSVSVVTFAAGSQYLETLGVEFGGFMVAVLALMETPAIIAALLLAGRNETARGEARSHTGLLREVFFGGASLMLVGSFVVGLISGPSGMTRLDVFVGPVFQGVLCLFLLDMGLVAARQLMNAPRLGPTLIGFAMAAPLVLGAAALGVTWAIGANPGDAIMLSILVASASYIAAPAAMRVALPQANAGVYLTLSLGVTFPFNIIIGIPSLVAFGLWLWA